MIPSLPHSRRDTKLTGDFRKTIKGHDFLLNEQEGEDKIMIFGKQEFLAMLCSLETVYMDGTFYSFQIISINSILFMVNSSLALTQI